VYVPSLELGLSHPSLASKCAPPQNQGGHTLLRVRGWGSPNSEDLRKSFALCILWLALSSQPGEWGGGEVGHAWFVPWWKLGGAVRNGRCYSVVVSDCWYTIYILYTKHLETFKSRMGIPQGSQSRSPIDERTILLRFLDIILRVADLRFQYGFLKP
jgi:hypothetical protein